MDSLLQDLTVYTVKDLQIPIQSFHLLYGKKYTVVIYHSSDHNMSNNAVKIELNYGYKTIMFIKTVK